jgi:sugar phosphate isomerase/epimerase
MHPAISINTLSLPPVPLDILVERVVRIGARGISPDLDQVTAFGVAASARAFKDSGLKAATLTHRAFAFASPEEAAAARERLLRTIDVAAAIGAETITLTTGGCGALAWPEAAARFAEAMAPCAEAAGHAGIALGVEPTSHLYADVSIAHRLADTVILARRAGIGVTIDLFACWSDADIEAAIAEASPLIRLVQVSDYLYGDRALPCRAVPGDGAVPLERLLPAIVRAGFAGWFDLEIIGPRLQQEGEEPGLRRAAAAVGKILAGERQ